MRIKVIFLLISLFFLEACSGINYEPVSIDYNKDNCETCNMGITDEQASAQAIAKDGTPSKFDDIGCLVVYMQENQDEIEKAYVHEHNTSEWIEMSTAYFIQSEHNETPMSYGIIAFSSEQDAEQWKNEHDGHLYSYDELVKVNVKDFKKDMKHSEGHGH